MAQHIVHFCESQTADTDTTMAFRALSEHGVYIYVDIANMLMLLGSAVVCI